jgi:hypothetical protein
MKSSPTACRSRSWRLAGGGRGRGREGRTGGPIRAEVDPAGHGLLPTCGGSRAPIRVLPRAATRPTGGTKVRATGAAPLAATSTSWRRWSARWEPVSIFWGGRASARRATSGYTSAAWRRRPSTTPTRAPWSSPRPKRSGWRAGSTSRSTPGSSAGCWKIPGGGARRTHCRLRSEPHNRLLIDNRNRDIKAAAPAVETRFTRESRATGYVASKLRSFEVM